MDDPRKALIGLMPDMETELIDSWLRKLETAGRDKVTYTRALVEKAKRLDGCEGFFVKMHRDSREDAWMEFELQRVRRKTERRANEQWPFPQGDRGCRQCHGDGWYPVRVNCLTDEEQAAYDRHRNNGFEAVMLRSEVSINSMVFICRDCNPPGAVLDEFQDRIYPRYPVYGAPLTL